MTAGTTEQLELEGPSVSRVEWAPVARVNLLPKEIGERRRFRLVQQGLTAVVLLVVALAGAAFWWSQQQVDDRRVELEAVQAQGRLLETQRAAYAEVPQTIARVEAAIDARAFVMANDILWYRYLTDLRNAAPDDVTFQSISLRVSGPAPEGQGAAAAPGAESGGSPFAPGDNIGSVAISGISGTYPKVADWMDALEKVNGLEVTTLDQATGPASGDSIDFASAITITSDALSHRFDRKAS